MTGKHVVALIGLTSVVAGAVMYYLQVYYYYEDVSAEIAEIRLTRAATGQPAPIPARDIRAIDADSSPLRFRACFTTPLSQTALAADFLAYDGPTPLTGPGWFDCYDAVAVGQALERGEAMAFLSRRDIRDGVDRVVAVFDDGRAFVWHQLNEKYQD